MGWTAQALSTAFLSLLFLTFLLLAGVGSDPQRKLLGFSWKVKLSIQRYLLIKTRISVMVAVSIWFVLFYMDVDLAALYALLTFMLNYVPHIGYCLSVLLPVPL